MKVWIVFSTWYKYGDIDCPINEVKGVFSSKEKAQKFADIWNKRNTGADYWVDDELEVDFEDLPIGYYRRS